jgi:hypothetical protein
MRAYEAKRPKGGKKLMSMPHSAISTCAVCCFTAAVVSPVSSRSVQAELS